MRNLIFSILALVAIMFATPALAFGGNDDHSCQGNSCNTTNNNNDSHDTNTTNAPVANGGQGGDGGDGFGLGIGVGVGGSATGGDAEVDDSGNSSVGNGYGNFSPDATVSHSGNSDVDNDVDVDTETTTVQGQLQGQLQGQQQGQAQNSDDDFVIEGDTTTYEAARIPVNSAAPVFASGCSQGVSAQMPTFGASVGSGNPVCDRVAIAGAYIAAGSREDALRVLADAEDSANWRSAFSKIRGVLTLGLF